MAKHDAMKGYERGYKKGPTSKDQSKKEGGDGRMGPAKAYHAGEMEEMMKGHEVTEKMGHGGHHTIVKGHGFVTEHGQE
jgi:hypothetical protein